MSELIDTTEMYLRTILELEEEGITPLRARIVERLDHSGPTVSQTISRMERDGLVRVRSDRRLQLTDEGRALAVSVMRKHRLAERLLADIVGLDWAYVHDEACRWEHVMSDRVEQRLLQILESPEESPYGTPIPAAGRDSGTLPGRPLDEVGARGGRFVVRSLAEGIQTDPELLSELDGVGIRPGATVIVTPVPGDDFLSVTGEGGEGALELAPATASHLRVESSD